MSAELNLITRERAQQALAGVSSFTNEELRIIDHILAAVSEAVRNYCGRDFVARPYDELYDGTGTAELLLRQYPVLSVERVAACPATVLRVSNTSSANQRASVQVTRDGLTLIRVASGTQTTDTSVTFAANATIAALATAITALGNGWSATAESAYENYASADLRPVQGALNAKNVQAAIKLHVEELSDYEVIAERGVLLYGGGAYAGWVRGWQNYRVIYSAGFEAVPGPVQEACAEWAAMLYWQSKRDPGARQLQIPGVTFQTFGFHAADVPPAVKALLAPYRRVVIGGL
jgi:uncharacterized protein YyaL (SSP411 family)